MKYITTIGEKQFLVEIIDDRHVSVDGKVYEVDFESVSGQPVYSLIVDGNHMSLMSRPAMTTGRCFCVAGCIQSLLRMSARGGYAPRQAAVWQRQVNSFSNRPCLVLWSPSLLRKVRKSKRAGFANSRVHENAE